MSTRSERADRRNAQRCRNCGELGAHYAPPGFGTPGTYSCGQKAVADTDPRSDDTLAKALWLILRGVIRGPRPEQTLDDYAAEVGQLLAAHPAMLARDASLVQQGRDEGWPCGNYRAPMTCLTVEGALAEDIGVCDLCQPVADKQRRQGRDEVAAEIEAVHAGTHQCVGGDWWTDKADYRGTVAQRGLCPTRAAVAAAGASDLARVRAKAWRSGVRFACDMIGYAHDGWDQHNPYRVAAEAGERQ